MRKCEKVYIEKHDSTITICNPLLPQFIMSLKLRLSRVQHGFITKKSFTEEFVKTQFREWIGSSVRDHGTLSERSSLPEEFEKTNSVDEFEINHIESFLRDHVTLSEDDSLSVPYLYLILWNFKPHLHFEVDNPLLAC